MPLFHSIQLDCAKCEKKMTSYGRETWWRIGTQTRTQGYCYKCANKDQPSDAQSNCKPHASGDGTCHRGVVNDAEGRKSGVNLKCQECDEIYGKVTPTIWGAKGAVVHYAPGFCAECASQPVPVPNWAPETFIGRIVSCFERSVADTGSTIFADMVPELERAVSEVIEEGKLTALLEDEAFKLVDKQLFPEHGTMWWEGGKKVFQAFPAVVEGERQDHQWESVTAPVFLATATGTQLTTGHSSIEKKVVVFKADLDHEGPTAPDVANTIAQVVATLATAQENAAVAAVVSCPNPHGLAARGGVLKNITIPVYMIHDTTGADLAKAVENQNPTWRAAAYEAITNLMNGRFRPVSDFLITLNPPTETSDVGSIPDLIDLYIRSNIQSQFNVHDGAMSDLVEEAVTVFLSRILLRLAIAATPVVVVAGAVLWKLR